MSVSKILRSLCTGVVTFAVLSSTVVAAVHAQSYRLHDSRDQFYVYNPAPNSYVSGTAQVRWVAHDDDRQNVPYVVTLRRGTGCQTEVGIIAQGRFTSSTNQNSVSWHTAGPLYNVSSVGDGNYCVEVCVSMRQNADPYTACNTRSVVVRNNNRRPVITSNPPENRLIRPGQRWQYDINATDADGDSVQYSIISGPAFARIDTRSGLLTVGPTNEIGQYQIRVAAIDGLGARGEQTFGLQVQAAAATTTSASSTASASTDRPIVLITEPALGAKLSGGSNRITWDVQASAAVIDTFVLAYRQLSSGNVQEIATVGSSTRSYIWDVTNLPSGSYQIEITANTESNVSTTATSQVFDIVAMGSGGDNSGSRPLIVEFTPELGSTVDTAKPQISGEFSPASDAAINPASLQVFIDTTDRTAWCTATSRGFSCPVQASLDNGLHQVRVAIRDTKERLAVSEWSFTVNVPDPAVPGQSGVLGSLNWSAVLILCFVVLIVFSVPWLLYYVWRRRRDDADIVVITPQETITPIYAPPPVTVSDSADSGWRRTVTNLRERVTQRVRSLGQRQEQLRPESTVKVEIQEPKPIPTVTIDPTQFDTYDDYVKAASAAQAAASADNVSPTADTVVVTTPPAEIKTVEEPTADLITTPDYAAEYKPPTKPKEEKSEPVSEKPKSSSGGDAPDWLQPV